MHIPQHSRIAHPGYRLILSANRLTQHSPVHLGIVCNSTLAGCQNAHLLLFTAMVHHVTGCMLVLYQPANIQLM